MKVSKLQQDISIGSGTVSGRLKQVDDFSAAFGEAEKSGHFLALSFDTQAEKLTTKVIGGSGKETDLTQDRFCVYRITSTSQKIELKATKGRDTTTKTYTLTGLVLE